jgi:hypothetical protein
MSILNSHSTSDLPPCSLGRERRDRARWMWRTVPLLTQGATAILAAGGALLLVSFAEAAAPIRIHPDNPHLFQWRGQPTVLVGSTEHYGAVLNLDFDYRTYLDTLHAAGLNLTRTVPGTYLESAHASAARGEGQNTLAPRPGRYLAPWARSVQPGYAGGGNKFDLDRWDENFFARLNLDPSFALDDATGSGRAKQHDGTFDGRAVRSQLKILRDFMGSLDLAHMRPTEQFLQHRPQTAKAGYVLEAPGRQYAVYIPRAGRLARFMADLPAGQWRAEWISPKDGRTLADEPFRHEGGARLIESPKYEEDVALRLTKVPSTNRPSP